MATANPTTRSEDITTKVVLQNVEVLAAGTRLEPDTPDGRRCSYRRDTARDPEESERLRSDTEARFSSRFAILDTATLGPQAEAGHPALMSQPRLRREKTVPGQPAPAPPPPPSVEVIKGDKRSQVVVG